MDAQTNSGRIGKAGSALNIEDLVLGARYRAHLNVLNISHSLLKCVISK